MKQNGKSKAGTVLLLIAAAIVASIALGHVAIIIGGADWYRAAGAGEEMAEMAASGSWIPALVTSAITLVFAVWALYAYAAAIGRFRLPILRPVLLVIAAIFIARGLAGIPTLAFSEGPLPDGVILFVAVTSAASLAIGLLYLLGTILRWKNLLRTQHTKPLP